ncbi:SDR family oxidoreductase [Shewanella sp. SG41-3]|uniref:UDP-glucose 4-epimerase family protein n=1 Tax=Shewanella sp. SG41-3 TaxID=2760977 RepID=UPI0016038BFC|nr:SDR family oxidoreductase [Shewanella sp. SG41-3]MBB1474358.1 SDR family oxidoreductase [Shewanella sp. SG41-3]
MHNILLTGGSGFLGKHLLNNLNKYQVRVLDRSHTKKHNQVTYFKSSIDSLSKYSLLLENVDTVIHCAARVHVMNDQSSNPLNEFREVNTAGTMNLARQAAEVGVKRFIFVSSIKVNGESTKIGKPFTEMDPRRPEDFYGQSKAEAEVQLSELATETGLEVVIIRPTLVYGPGVKANFASLLNLVSKGLPLPFGRINDNKRSLVSVKNLVDLIVTCIDHPKAVNQVFLVSDDNDVSTASMVQHMSQALGKSSRLLPVPLWCYRLVGKLTGKTDVVDRLIGSLQVDISHTKDTLGWVPPQTLEEGFKETAEAFILNKNK